MNSEEVRKRIEKSLQDAVRDVPSKKKRLELLEELESHVWEAYQHHIDAGLSSEAALSLSLKDLGGVNTLNRDFSVVYPPFYRQPLFWFSAAFFVLVIGVPWAMSSLSREFSKKAEDREQLIESKIDQLVEDQRQVARFLIGGAATQTGKDAGSEFNFRIQWSKGQGDLAYARRGSPISTTPELRNLLRQRGNASWIDALTTHRTSAGFSTRWMRDLRNYEYWELFRNSPVESALSESPVNSFSIPVPDYDSLIEIAMIRLIQGATESNPIESLREVRHLARLLSTQEVIVANLAALRLLTVEREMYDRLVSNQRIQAKDWEPFPERTEKRVRLAVYASMDIFNVMKIDSHWDKLLAAKPIGLCAGLTEGIDRAGLVRSLIEGRWPLEKDYRPTIAKVDEILSSNGHGCRLVVARAQWKNYWHEITPETFLMGDREASMSLKLMSRGATLPYVRRLAAEVLNSVAIPTTRYWHEADAK